MLEIRVHFSDMSTQQTILCLHNNFFVQLTVPFERMLIDSAVLNHCEDMRRGAESG